MAGMRTIRADLLRYRNPGIPYQAAEWNWRKIVFAVISQQGAWAVLDYRFRHWVRKLPAFVSPPLRIIEFLSRKIIESITGISIASTAKFGPGLYIGHFGGIIVGPDVVVGENCNLSQGVTLGEYQGSPTIGDCVYLAPGSKVFGLITVGDHVRVGANAVVNNDIPPFSTAVGVPARVIETPWPTSSERVH
jgi:serine O-acetyltransferase